MGKRAIPIAHITNNRDRGITFNKRRKGLFNKAHEIGELCNAKVALIVYSERDHLHVYHNVEDPIELLQAANFRLATPDEHTEIRTPANIKEATSPAPRKKRKTKASDANLDENGDIPTGDLDGEMGDVMVHQNGDLAVNLDDDDNIEQTLDEQRHHEEAQARSHAAAYATDAEGIPYAEYQNHDFTDSQAFDALFGGVEDEMPAIDPNLDIEGYHGIELQVPDDTDEVDGTM